MAQIFHKGDYMFQKQGALKEKFGTEIRFFGIYCFLYWPKEKPFFGGDWERSMFAKPMKFRIESWPCENWLSGLKIASPGNPWCNNASGWTFLWILSIFFVCSALFLAHAIFLLSLSAFVSLVIWGTTISSIILSILTSGTGAEVVASLQCQSQI